MPFFLGTGAVARILHLTHTNISYDNRILKQMEVLARDTANVVQGIGVYADEGAADTRQNINAEIVTLHLFSRRLSFLPKVLRYPLVLIELLWRLAFRGTRFQPQIIQCHDTMVLPAAVLIKSLTGAVLIYDAHELESDKNGSPKLVSWAILVLEKLSWPRIDALISVSPSIVDWYHEHLGPKRSIVVLNSPHLERHGEDGGGGKQGAYFRDKFGIPTDALVFIYVGLFGAGRGIEKLLAAFSSPKVRSHLVFLGYGELKDLILSHAERNGKVHLHEAVPHERVVPIVKHADFGLCLIEAVSLSDFYCLPNKLFEYCFAGVPVLASKFPELERVVREYQLGYCTDLDEQCIAEAIRTMESNGAREVTGDLHDLSWDAQEQKLLQLYRSFSERLSAA